MIDERAAGESVRLGPLDGLLVLDCGTALAGPVCATLLAEFGARVIKVERPGTGDTLRSYGPRIDDVPLWWLIEGRNKQSVTLDLGTPDGQRLLRLLAARADVLIENFRPGTMTRWGLDRDHLAAVNPRLVYVSISGYGQHGPYSDRPAYDRVAQGMSGFTYLTGYPGQPPVRPGIGVTDYTSAVFAALGAMYALYERDAQGSGRGQHVDVALYESQLRMLHYFLPAYERTGEIPERTGNLNPAMAPAETFAAEDGAWVTVAVGTQRNFRSLVAAMGRPELADDPRFATNDTRVAHHVEIHALVGAWIATRPRDEVLRRLAAAGVPAGALYTVGDVHSDPHFRQRGSVTTVHDPRLGEIAVQGVVPTLSATPGILRSTGPLLGEHNDEVFLDLLGVAPDELTKLRTKGVV